MHRSGTSLVANTLNKAGVYMGAFRDHNGEALHFLSLNQQMLKEAGGNWLNPVEPNEKCDLTLPADEIFAEHIKAPSPKRAMLHASLNWGWKDPRNTFTLKLWLKRFPQAKVLHVVRDGRAVALSLKNRNDVRGEVQEDQLNDLAFNFDLWEKYVAQSQRFSSLGKNYLEIRYEDILNENATAVKSLEDFVGTSVKEHVVLKKGRQADYQAELNELAAKSEVFQKIGYPL
jgi:hypothetical protein